MERTQFTFYDSWLKSISRIKNKAARCDAYEAICRYALYGETPQMDKIAESAAMVFTMAKPNLDVSRVKAENGKKSKTKRSKPEANEEQTEAKPEQEQEQEKEEVKEKEKEKVKEQYVISARARGMMTEMGISFDAETVEKAVRSLGEAAVLDAIRKAGQNGAKTWGYVQKILENPRPAKKQSNEQFVQHGQISPMMAAAARKLMEEMGQDENQDQDQ